MNMIKIAFVVCCAAFAAAEAEADAALLYGGYGYGAGLGYAGLGYGAGLGYAGLGYGYGLAAPVATGYGVSNVANTVGIAGVAPAALPALAGGYAGAGSLAMVLDLAMLVLAMDMDLLPQLLPDTESP